MSLLSLWIAVFLLWGPCAVQARAVFAHFMVTNTHNWTLAEWESDISAAKDAHIDAFALNMAAGDLATEIALPLAFEAADNHDFGLFFSFDYAGNGSWHEKQIISMLDKYTSHTSYYHYKGKPFVSTFEGPEYADDWDTIKKETNCFFVPDWSSLPPKDALALGPADGLFSWAAWPHGRDDMTTKLDQTYLDSLKGKPYIMPISPWFYTNLPGYDKNWLWRGDDLWFQRWQQVDTLDPVPEFLEIISWNDYGESHYIGPLHDNSMDAFRIGKAPYNYAQGMPHDGWRLFLPYLIEMYKTGKATVTQEGLQVWYRLTSTSTSACKTGKTSANTASQNQTELAPADVIQDEIFFSALLKEPANVNVTIGGTVVSAEWTSTPDGGSGLYHGTAPFNDLTGEVVVSIVRAEAAVVACLAGASLEDSCPSEVQNYNAWVGSATATLATPTPTPTESGASQSFGGLGASFQMYLFLGSFLLLNLFL